MSSSKNPKTTVPKTLESKEWTTKEYEAFEENQRRSKVDKPMKTGSWEDMDTGRNEKIETRIMHCGIEPEVLSLHSLIPSIMVATPLEKCLTSDLMGTKYSSSMYSEGRGMQTDNTFGETKTGGVVTGKPGTETYKYPTTTGRASDAYSGYPTHDTVKGKHSTRIALENNLCLLEDAKFSITFPSGTSALSTIGFLFESGNHVLVLGK